MNEDFIWKYLKAQGLSDAGAAGLMGNLFAESGLSPINLQNSFEKKLGFNDQSYTMAVDSGRYINFVHDSAGYGLCQWTYWSRKEALLNFAKAAKVSVGDLEMQLAFMMKELRGYPTLLEILKTTTSVSEASDAVLTGYERPADQGSSVRAKRTGYGKKYFEQFASKPDNAVLTAIDKLAKLGVINSPDYWKAHYGDVTYVDSLLKKSAAKIERAGDRCATVENGVKALHDAGIIDSPAYWLKQGGNVAELLKALGGAALQNDALSEAALRQKVCDIVNDWYGGERGGRAHQEILKIYNNYKPLARGYTVKVSDAYCATTTSAAYIKAGIAEYTGTECGVEELVKIAQKKGIWVENDAHIPQIGDACVYDWQDGKDYAKTDNQGRSDHVGIVTAVSRASGAFTVTEGNTDGGKIGKRSMYLNGRYIRGFICPNYGEIAKKLAK